MTRSLDIWMDDLVCYDQQAALTIFCRERSCLEFKMANVDMEMPEMTASLDSLGNHRPAVLRSFPMIIYVHSNI